MSCREDDMQRLYDSWVEQANTWHDIRQKCHSWTFVDLGMVKPLNGDMYAWLVEYAGNDWDALGNEFIIKDSEVATLFALRWS